MSYRAYRVTRDFIMVEKGIFWSIVVVFVFNVAWLIYLNNSFYDAKSRVEDCTSRIEGSMAALARVNETDRELKILKNSAGFANRRLKCAD